MQKTDLFAHVIPTADDPIFKGLKQPSHSFSSQRISNKLGAQKLVQDVFGKDELSIVTACHLISMGVNPQGLGVGELIAKRMEKE